MKIQSRQTQYSSSVNFQASISPQLEELLHRQVKLESNRKRTTKLLEQQLEQQLENITRWGNKDTVIVRAKDYRGKYRLGIQYNIVPTLNFTWAIQRPSGKTELSQFLALKEIDIFNTEKTIKYLYTKYGGNFFNRFK